MADRTALIAEIVAERDRHLSLGYDWLFDDEHSIEEWGGTLLRQLGLAMPRVTGTVNEKDYDMFRSQLVRVGSVILAALEAEDRRRDQERQRSKGKVAGDFQAGSGF